jgi:hypothetical protein
LLRDLDIEGPKSGGAGKAERDYFDFSVDSDDVKTDKRELRGKNTDWQVCMYMLLCYVFTYVYMYIILYIFIYLRTYMMSRLIKGS